MTNRNKPKHIIGKQLLCLLLTLLSIGTVASQERAVRNSTMGIGDDLGTNMSEEDRLRANGDSVGTDIINVPVDLKQWTIDSRLGDVTSTEVDTAWHQFQNDHLNGGMEGEYNHLGNIGSPRYSRIFMEQAMHTQRFFTDVYGHFYISPDKFRFTDTKSPYTNLTYYSAGNKLTGDDHLTAYLALNANKRIGMGVLFDYLYGRGQYNSQSTAFFNASLYGYYRGDRYQLYFLASRYHLKMAENGGITDDRYITDPLSMAEGERTYSAEDIPTRLDRTWNRNDSWNVLLTHRYNLGFYQEAETDSTQEEFVPVSSFIHTAEVQTNNRSFISYQEPKNFYLNDYLPYDSIDRTKYLSVRNTAAIALCEGFNKWAQAGLTAFITYEYRHFTLPDSVPGSNRERTSKYKENIISIGGKLSRAKGKFLNYDIIGETVIAGEDLGQFSIDGNARLNFRLFKDTVNLEAKAYIKNTNPSFYFRHYHAQHYWWDNNNLDKEFRTRIEGTFGLKKTKTNLRVGIENIKNFTYFANLSQPSGNTQGASAGYANAIGVAQAHDYIQVFSAKLKQDFKLGIFHLDNVVTYQKSSNNDILPLPELSLYHNFYLKFKLAKVLSMELGADLRYFTAYTAPDYSPALGQFYQQNPADRIEIGNYPIVNAYINAHLKRTRFYVMMYHVNQGTGASNYFLAPHYPIAPRTFQLGLSWNFFD